MGRKEQVDPIFGLPVDEDPEAQGEEPEEGASTDAGPEPQENEGEPAADQAGPEDEKQAAESGEPAGKPGESKPQRLIAGKFKSYEDLEKSYKELERKLGARDSEKDELRRRLEQLEQAVSRLVPAPGFAPNAPPGAPVGPQPLPALGVGVPPAWAGTAPGGTPFAPPTVTATAQTPASVTGAPVPASATVRVGDTPAPPPEPADTPEFQQQWLERFYGEPTRAVRELIREEFQRQWYQQGQVLGQALAPYVSYIERQRVREAMAQRVARFRESHPDLDEYQEEFLQVLREHPDLAAYPPEGDQDRGLERVYQLAKARKLLSQANQQSQPETVGPAPASPEANKRAARMPAPTGARTLTGQKSPDEAIREAIFGTANEAQGVFD